MLSATMGALRGITVIDLSRVLAESTTLHGVFLDVLEMGVLITGASAIGKSELALELISRGNGLIADDIVELFRISPDTIDYVNAHGTSTPENENTVTSTTIPIAQKAPTSIPSKPRARQWMLPKL